jgi:hypothetical protein
MLRFSDSVTKISDPLLTSLPTASAIFHNFNNYARIIYSVHRSWTIPMLSINMTVFLSSMVIELNYKLARRFISILQPTPYPPIPIPIHQWASW